MPAVQVMDLIGPTALLATFGAQKATSKRANDDEDDGDGPYKQQPLAVRSDNRPRDELTRDCDDIKLVVDTNRANHSSPTCKKDQIIDSISMDKVAITISSSSNVDDQQQQQQQQQQQPQPEVEIKCSAVHSLERDMPDFDYSHLVKELRSKIINECKTNAGIYDQADVDKCRHDEWFVERFLLRQKLDVDKAFDMLKRTMRYRNELLARSIRPEDWPAEFYQVGGLFGYEDDRKGNKMLYIRLKIHRKMPEIQLVLQSFLYYNINRLDELANGKGVAIVLDCSGAGLANADMDMMVFLISTLVNYFPKGMSYLLVHELPWILKPFWPIAKAFLAEEHRELIKFSNSRTIYEYVNRENLPDFMDGTCTRSYRTPPDNCTNLEQASKLWGIEPEVAKRLLHKFAQYLPAEIVYECETIGIEDDEDKNNNDSNQENKGRFE